MYLFGPVKVLLGFRGKQPIKIYKAVFVCFASTAVQWEIVKDFNTFILCLSMLMGRRWPVVKLYCDNATNFVGAARILKDRSSCRMLRHTDSPLNSLLPERHISVVFGRGLKVGQASFTQGYG